MANKNAKLSASFNSYTKTQLVDQLLNLQTEKTKLEKTNSELTGDIKAIAAEIGDFLSKTSIPNKFSIFWVISNAGNVFKLIRNIFIILKEKQHV